MPHACATCLSEGRVEPGTVWCATCERWRCGVHAVTDAHYVPAPEERDDQTAELFGPEPELL